jgi:hypothetical protein
MGKKSNQHPDSTDPSICLKIPHTERIGPWKEIHGIARTKQQRSDRKQPVLLPSMAPSYHYTSCRHDNDKIYKIKSGLKEISHAFASVDRRDINDGWNGLQTLHDFVEILLMSNFHGEIPNQPAFRVVMKVSR